MQMLDVAYSMCTTFHLLHRLQTKHHSTAVTRYRCPTYRTAFAANGNCPLHWSKRPTIEVTRSSPSPAYRFWTLDLYTFYMTCKLELDISIITEPVYYYRLVYSI